MKKDLSNELTVFVIATEKERNYIETLHALKKQTVNFTLKQILDVEPINEAFNQMLYQCDTPYFCQIDEDMILNPNAIETMYNTLNAALSNVAMARFKLHDAYLDKIIGSVIIYRNNIAQCFKWDNTPFCDLNRHKKILNSGYVIYTSDTVLGVHHPHWNNLSIFRKFAIRSEKVKRTNIPDDEFLKSLISKIQGSISELDLYALLGYCVGLFTNSNGEKDYSTLLKKEFNTINSVFANKLKKEETRIRFITMEKNNLVRELGKYIDLEIVNTIDEIKNSNKPIILWNGYTGLKLKSHMWKTDLINYCKENNRVYYIFERGALPDSLFLDKHGFLYDSESYQINRWNKTLSQEELDKTQKFIEDFKNNKKSLENQKNNKLQIDNNNKIVFIPLQVENDTVIQLWSDWVIDQQHFYEIITKLALDLPNYTFLVKNHPIQIKKRLSLFESCLPNIKIVDDVHYKDCIDVSDVVININSSVGLQSMMWEKPVLILGDAFYHFSCLNIKADNYNILKDLLKYNLYYKPDKNLMLQFIYYLKYKFYTEANLIKTGINSTSLTSIKTLNFESPYNNTMLTYKFDNVQIEHQPLIVEFLKILNDNGIYPCLVQKSCLEALTKKINHNTNSLHIQCNINNKTFLDLQNSGFKIDDCTIKKNGFTVHYCTKKIKSTKDWTCLNYQVVVPLPVVAYLNKLYGKDWRNK